MEVPEDWRGKKIVAEINTEEEVEKSPVFGEKKTAHLVVEDLKDEGTLAKSK